MPRSSRWARPRTGTEPDGGEFESRHRGEGPVIGLPPDTCGSDYRPVDDEAVRRRVSPGTRWVQEVGDADDDITIVGFGPNGDIAYTRDVDAPGTPPRVTPTQNGRWQTFGTEPGEDPDTLVAESAGARIFFVSRH